MNSPFFFALLLVFASCSPQERIENQMMQCYAQSLSANQVDSIVNGLGDYLVTQGVLESTNADAYEDLITKVMNREQLPMIHEDTTHAYLIKPYIKDFGKIAKCLNQIKESPEWENSIPGRSEQAALNLENMEGTPDLAKIFLEMIDSEDYKLPWYKFQVQKAYDFYNSEMIRTKDSSLISTN